MTPKIVVVALIATAVAVSSPIYLNYSRDQAEQKAEEARSRDVRNASARYIRVACNGSVEHCRFLVRFTKWTGEATTYEVLDGRVHIFRGGGEGFVEADLHPICTGLDAPTVHEDGGTRDQCEKIAWNAANPEG